MRRALFVVTLLASLALAQGRRGKKPPTEDEVRAVRELVGEEAWGLMAEWRRRSVVHRYQRFLAAPASKQESIREMGLKKYLTSGAQRRGPSLPSELEEALSSVPREQRRTAHKLAVVRLRQLRLDRNLSLLPAEDRRRWFERLFPEPFDPAAVRSVRKDFEKHVAKAFASSLRPKLAALQDLPEEKRRARTLELVRKETEKREQKLIAHVRRDIERLARARDRTPADVELLLDRGRILATPRQRELLRWALRPQSCPLLDFAWMGERPKNRGARRVWDRDFATLARMELLGRADFPPDVVLHLTAAGSDADFLRAAHQLLAVPSDAPRNQPKNRR